MRGLRGEDDRLEIGRALDLLPSVALYAVPHREHRDQRHDADHDAQGGEAGPHRIHTEPPHPDEVGGDQPGAQCAVPPGAENTRARERSSCPSGEPPSGASASTTASRRRSSGSR